MNSYTITFVDNEGCVHAALVLGLSADDAGWRATRDERVMDIIDIVDRENPWDRLPDRTVLYALEV